MKYLTRGSFGVVLAIGGALAVMAALGGDRSTAAAVAVVTVALALAVFLRVDRRRR